MRQHLRVIVLEDAAADAELIIAELQAGGYTCDWRRVDDEASFRAALAPDVDLILADYSVPLYSAVGALSELKRRALDIPFIVITGAQGEEKAVDCLRLGATDYLLKDRLARLPGAVARALEDRRAREVAQHTHDALLESEARFRHLAENAQDIIFRYRLAEPRGFEYVSPAATAITGYTPEEHYRDPDLGLKLAHPDDRWWLEAACDANTPIEAPREMRWLRKDGQIVWTEQRLRAMCDEQGCIVAVEGIARDITDRKRAEEAVQTSRQALQTIIDASPFAIIEIDDEQRVKLWNAAAERLFGWTAAETIGRANPIVPEEYENEYQSNCQRALAGDRLLQQTRRRRKDGTMIDVLLSVAPIADADGRITSAVGMLADISDQTRAEALLREREEHFRSLIENALDIIAVIDLEGIVTYISPSVETVLGYRESDIVGSRSVDWLHPDDVPGASRTIADIIAGAAEQRVLTVRGRHADGSWRSLEMMVKARRDDQNVGFVIINARDITDRESLEDQLRQSQKMEAIGRLAGGIAHDFNNLLTAILGYGELMLDRLPEASDLRPDIAEIIKAGERAGALTRQLLAFSRKQVLQPQRLNLNTVITDFEKMLGRVIGEDVRLVTRLSSPLGVVHADRGQIEQVLMNMAVNARDAMPRGGTLVIETRTAAFADAFRDRQARLEPGRWVCLTVSDTGCGMPADVAARVFEPFYTTKAPGKGTGLGLSTVYGIVAQSGGQIAVESTQGTGTTFRVYLPEVSRAPSEEFKSERAADRFGGTETILLVEDEFGIRKLIRKALERQGYTVLEAATGEQAIAMAKRHSGTIDLLLSDIVMPGMSGVDVAQHLVAERPQLKVMHISGFAVAAHVGRLSPNVTFLQKPFTVDALSRQVRQCLDSAAGGGAARR